MRVISSQPTSTTIITSSDLSPDFVSAIPATRRTPLSIHRGIQETFGDDDLTFMGPILCASHDQSPSQYTHIWDNDVYKSALGPAIAGADSATNSSVTAIRPDGGIGNSGAVRSARTRFRPSYAVARAASPLLLGHQQGGGGLPSTQISTGYRGNMAASSYKDDSGIPEHNTAVWIRNIPPNITLGEVFSTIRTGAVHCLVLNPPTGRHYTCAAKLAFQSRVAAVAFMDQAHSKEGIVIGGRRLIVGPNRVTYPENHHGSRVVNIYCYHGQGSITYFEEYFRSLFKYELEVARQLDSSVPGAIILQFSFSSVRCQAAWAVDAINREPLFEGIFTAVYGKDPCTGI